MKRIEATERILAAKKEKKLSFGALAKAVGRHPVWATSALLGQATMSADEAQKAVGALGLGAEMAAALQEMPTCENLADRSNPALQRCMRCTTCSERAMHAIPVFLMQRWNGKLPILPKRPKPEL